MGYAESLHIAEKIHAVVFAGGSVFGLEAASGVRRFLDHKGAGFQIASARGPLLGMARAIDPVNTLPDGDLVVALSLGNVKAPVESIGVAATEAVVESILRAVRMAPSLGGLPGLKK